MEFIYVKVKMKLVQQWQEWCLSVTVCIVIYAVEVITFMSAKETIIALTRPTLTFVNEIKGSDIKYKFMLASLNLKCI